MSNSSKKIHYWTSEESAFILNWVDHCLLKKQKYRRTIVRAFKDNFVNTLRLDDRIIRHIDDLARRYGVSGPKVIKYGTGCIEKKLPDDLRELLYIQPGVRRVGSLEGAMGRDTPADTTESLRPTQQLQLEHEPGQPALVASLSPTSHMIPVSCRTRAKSVKPNEDRPNNAEDDNGILHSPKITGTLDKQAEAGAVGVPYQHLKITSPTVSAITVKSFTTAMSDSYAMASETLDNPRTPLEEVYRGIAGHNDVVTLERRESDQANTTERLTNLSRTIGKSSKAITRRAAHGMKEGRRVAVSNHAVVSSWVGQHNRTEHSTLPSTPSTIMLAEKWMEFRTPLQLAFKLIGEQDSLVEEQDSLPQLLMTRYLAHEGSAILKKLLESPDLPTWIHDLPTWIHGLALLYACRHVSQIIMSVVLVAASFPSCKPLLDIKEWKISDTSLINGETVKNVTTTKFPDRLDAMLPSEAFGLGDHDAQHQVDELIQTWSCCWQIIRPMVPLMDTDEKLRSWARHAVQLDREMRMSPLGYSYHYCWPGTLFNASWMQAEDYLGSVPPECCSGKQVLMCVFPLLLQHSATAHTVSGVAKDSGDARPFQGQIEQQIPDPKIATIISKAVVWLQEWW